MKIIEIISASIAGYIFNYDIGIITFFILKSIFSNNYKISLFMLLNLSVYLFFGLSYILFTKLYLFAIISIFFYDNIRDFITDNKKNNKKNNISKLKSIYNKIIDFYNLINIMVSLPVYIIYDNISCLLDYYGYRQKILNNKLVNKFNKKYILIKNLSNSEMSNLDNYENKEFDKLLNIMVSPDKFFDTCNDMRESIGKKRLINMRFSNLMEDNNDNVEEVNSFFKMFKNSLDKLI
jgi:hypothetical protein